MKRLVVLSVLSVGALLLVVSWASAGPRATKPTKFAATLNAGQEVPHPKGVSSGASGKFTATLTNGQLKWTLTFGHLTGNGTAAHLHKAPKGKPGPVAVGLCTPCKSPASGTIVGEAANSAATAMAKGQYYVNVHTAKNPSGEIRGQVKKAG